MFRILETQKTQLVQKIEHTLNAVDVELLKKVHEDFLNLIHDAEMYQTHLARNRSARIKRKKGGD
jgi:hypothetical protein